MASTSRHSPPGFVPVTDPVSGTVSFCLDQRVAPLQRHLYYTNPSIGPDERWLWFLAIFPPARQATLAVACLDPDGPPPRLLMGATPGETTRVCPSGDAAWFCSGPEVWRVDVKGKLDRIGVVPAEMIAGRQVFNLATHLSLSANGRHLLLDAMIGGTTVVMTLEIATGRIERVAEFDTRHNHAQFSPHDPDLMLIARDQYRNPLTGEFIHHTCRTHLLRRDGSGYRCINAQFRCSPYKGACHEWWLSDGRIAYVEYDTGVWVHDLRTGTDEHVWQEPLCHAHADATARFWCADQSPYFWAQRPCQVLFMDAQTGRRHVIHAGLPLPPAPREVWHLDPHPQFSPRGTWVVWMSTARNRVDVALTPVADLVRRME